MTRFPSLRHNLADTATRAFRENCGKWMRRCLRIIGGSRVKPDSRVKWSVPAPTMTRSRRKRERERAVGRYIRDDILPGTHLRHQPVLPALLSDPVHSLSEGESKRTFDFAARFTLHPILSAQTWSYLERNVAKEAHSASPYKRGVISRHGPRVDNFSRNEDRTHSSSSPSLSSLLCLSPRVRFRRFFPFLRLDLSEVLIANAIMSLLVLRA